MNTPNATTPRALLAASLYFGALFALGFLCGLVRVPILEPRLGELAALACEAPVMVAGMLLAAPAVTRRCGVPPKTGPRLLMGLAALALLLAVELLTAWWVSGQPPGRLFGRFATPPGMLSGVLYLLFAVAPALPRRSP